MRVRGDTIQRIYIQGVSSAKSTAPITYRCYHIVTAVFSVPVESCSQRVSVRVIYVPCFMPTTETLVGVSGSRAVLLPGSNSLYRELKSCPVLVRVNRLRFAVQDGPCSVHHHLLTSYSSDVERIFAFLNETPCTARA